MIITKLLGAVISNQWCYRVRRQGCRRWTWGVYSEDRRSCEASLLISNKGFWLLWSFKV